MRFATMRHGPSRPRASRGTQSRVLYLMHPSDPIVWWGSQLIFTSRTGSANRRVRMSSSDDLGAVRDVLADHRRSPVRHRGAGRARTQIHRPSTSTAGMPFCSPLTSPPSSSASSKTSSPASDPSARPTSMHHKPRHRQREGVGRYVRNDGRQETARTQPEPAEQNTSDERDRDRADTSRPRPTEPAVDSVVVGHVCKVGAMCHRPKSAEVAKVAPRTPKACIADPSSTPRKANSSGMAVSSNSDTSTSWSRCPPLMFARESCRKPFVAGITAARTEPSRPPEGAGPITRPRPHPPGPARGQPGSAPVLQATRTSAPMRTAAVTTGGPSNPCPRATVNATRTPTVSRNSGRPS